MLFCKESLANKEILNKCISILKVNKVTVNALLNRATEGFSCVKKMDLDFDIKPPEIFSSQAVLILRPVINKGTEICFHPFMFFSLFIMPSMFWMEAELYKAACKYFSIIGMLGLLPVKYHQPYFFLITVNKLIFAATCIYFHVLCVCV